MYMLNMLVYVCQFLFLDSVQGVIIQDSCDDGCVVCWWVGVVSVNGGFYLVKSVIYGFCIGGNEGVGVDVFII